MEEEDTVMHSLIFFWWLLSMAMNSSAHAFFRISLLSLEAYLVCKSCKIQLFLTAAVLIILTKPTRLLLTCFTRTLT